MTDFYDAFDKLISPKAAGVLIFNEGKHVLALRRNKDGETGLPCGKVEGNESLEEAAIRECLEETGFKVRLEGKPFIAFEDNTSQHVAIFKATILKWQKREIDEGTPVWIPTNQMLTGKFGKYNRKVFEHFDIPIEE